MSDSSWYRVERILNDKYDQKGARVEKFYEVQWAPTWEPAKRIKAQVPLIVEEYERQKRNSNSGAASHGPSPKKCRLAGKIKILGITHDNGRDVEDSIMVVENVHTGERSSMRYEDIKRDHQTELIQFFEQCVCGFTK